MQALIVAEVLVKNKSGECNTAVAERLLKLAGKEGLVIVFKGNKYLFLYPCPDTKHIVSGSINFRITRIINLHLRTLVCSLSPKNKQSDSFSVQNLYFFWKKIVTPLPPREAIFSKKNYKLTPKDLSPLFPSKSVFFLEKYCFQHFFFGKNYILTTPINHRVQ